MLYSGGDEAIKNCCHAWSLQKLTATQEVVAVYGYSPRYYKTRRLHHQLDL